MSRLGRIFSAGLVVLFAGTLSPAQEQLTPLNTIAAIERLTQAQADRSRPVLVRAIVTFYTPNNKTLFVQDQTAGIYIRTNGDLGLRPGDVVIVEGVTASSYHNVIVPHSVHKVGTTRLPIARVSGFRRLITGEDDCQYVQVSGMVRSATLQDDRQAPFLLLELAAPGGIIEARVYNRGSLKPRDLLGATVSVTGVGGGTFDGKFEIIGVNIHIFSGVDVRILVPPPPIPQGLPVTAIPNFMQGYDVSDQSRPIRVRGTVTLYHPGNSLVIESAGKAILVHTHDNSPLRLGEVVDAIGFADFHDSAPSLEQGEFFPTGMVEQVNARQISHDEALTGLFTFNLVSSAGKVVEQVHEAHQDTLVLETDDHHLVSAVLQTRSPDESLAPVRLGSGIVVTGICYTTVGGPWKKPESYIIQLRSPSDVRVVVRPGWWDSRRLLYLIGGLSALLLACLIWTSILRGRVRKQTSMIRLAAAGEADKDRREVTLEKSRSAILEAINGFMPLEQIFELIRGFVEQRLPGCQCSFIIKDVLEDISGDPTVSVPTLPKLDHLSLMRPILSNSGKSLGSLTISYAAEVKEQRYRHTFDVACNLAALAIENRRLYEGLTYRSQHDPLTELPNRRFFEERLNSLLRVAQGTGERIALIYIDLNQFKKVNDSFGHAVGDLYLQQVAKRLAGKLRSTDILARVGGDEFVVIASSLLSTEEAGLVAQRLNECFEERFELGKVFWHGSASFGQAVFPDDGVSGDELNRKADLAMYGNKQSRAIVRPWVSQSVNPSAESLDTIVSVQELSNALTDGNFFLCYQPQFSADRQLLGIEALIRLSHPILGTLSPDDFIPTAERSGLIVPIGAWVLREACYHAKQWSDELNMPIKFEVNVSALQLNDASFVPTVLAVLAETGLCPQQLELEITESSLFRDLGNTIIELERLRAIGVRISLDDFGVGYSSLHRLHKLPVDTIKIDREFTSALLNQRSSASIVRSIVSLASSLNARVVAEGIEIEAELTALIDLGVAEFQGYLFSKPLTSKQVAQKLESWRVHKSVEAHPLSSPVL